MSNLRMTPDFRKLRLVLRIAVFALCSTFTGCGGGEDLSGGEIKGLDDQVGQIVESPAHNEAAVTSADEVSAPPARLAAFESEPVPLLKPQPVDQISRSVSRSAPILVESPSETDPAERAFMQLVDARDNPKPTAWEEAEQTLEKLGKDAVPTLISKLNSPDVDVRELATMWLVRLGPDAANTERELARVLDDESDFVRVNAASALSHLPAYSDRVIPTLTELLSHAEFSVRITAATALGNAGELAASAVPQLVETLDGEDDLQAAALTTLGRIGPAAKPALPAVQQLWQTSANATVKAAASEAFQAIQGEQ